MINNDEIQEIMRIFSPDKMPDFSKLFSSDISKPEYAILLTCKHIRNSGKQIYVSDVVKKFSITPQAISKHLRSCEKKGYIERSVDKDDRRNVIITITPEGEKALEESHNRAMLLRDRMIDKIGMDEFTELVKRIRYYRDLLSETIEDINNESEGVIDVNE